MRLPSAVAAVIAATALAACGSDASPGTPAACLSGTGAYLDALESAPADVQLAGSVAIGDCLPDEQDAGELTQVGEVVIAAATRLNTEARKDPSGPAPVELGYLVGALGQAAQDTGGIHQDLIRRLETAARFSPQGERLPQEFQQGFARGLAAGQASE